MTHSLKDAAKELGVSPRTIERWVAQRTVPSYKIGRRRLVDVEEIRRTHHVPMVDDRVEQALRRA